MWILLRFHFISVFNNSSICTELMTTALATFISRFQTRAASSGRYETLSSEERKILQGAGLTLSKLAESRRAFNQINSEKLTNRAKVLLDLGATSPSRGFKGDWTSSGS